MKSLSYIIIGLILVSSCATWKGVLISKGDHHAAIQNAIHDFLNTSSLSKEDSVFKISVTEDYSDEILAINIYGTTNKLLISTEDSVNYDVSSLAVDYRELNGKLFYWYDSTKEVTQELTNTLINYNMVDTTIVNVYIPPRHIDHAKKGVDYFFCKNNLSRYKKVKTNKALGYYDPPQLNCN